MIVDRDLPIPMDDGLILRADVFRPPGPGPFPVIMSLGPYGKSLPFASEWFAARFERLLAGHPEIADGSSCAHMNWETVDPERWIPHGYAVVRADSRGAGALTRGGSTCCRPARSATTTWPSNGPALGRGATGGSACAGSPIRPSTSGWWRRCGHRTWPRSSPGRAPATTTGTCRITAGILSNGFFERW